MLDERKNTMKMLMIWAIALSATLNAFAQTKTKVTVEVANDAPPPHYSPQGCACGAEPYLGRTDASDGGVRGHADFASFRQDAPRRKFGWHFEGNALCQQLPMALWYNSLS